MSPTVDFNDDTAALDYIRKRGYASYSSMTNVRDCRIPTPFVSSEAQIFGKELHSRWLEGNRIETLTPTLERKLKEMLDVLNSDTKATALLQGATVEEKFEQSLQGVNVLGYIDIHGKSVADLKTTRHTSKKAFVASMDFLQAALYLAVTKKKNFYYIGISKEKPYKVMVFSVHEYPERLKAAQRDLKRLLKYLKKKL